MADMDSIIDITPVPVSCLPAFMRAIEPIVREIAAGDILSALMRHTDAVISATAIGARVDRDWLGQQTPDVLVELAARVMEVNADFFVRRVLPAINAAAERLATIASGGTSGSHASSAPDSPTAT